MLTRLEANGFKNLVDFALDFGPYTCIAGANGVGKSNIFDAIRFLSLLTEHTMNDAARGIRDTSSGESAGDLADIFFAADGHRHERFQLAVEMLVGRGVSDDFGRRAESTSTFLRYEVFCMEEPENGIHPASLEAMDLLLHDIAVDPNELVGDGNPLRQVVVVTHSPYFVQLQREDELVLAKNVLRKTDLGVTRPLVCLPCLGTWRGTRENPGIGRVALQSYLLPPEGRRITIQDELWAEEASP